MSIIFGICLGLGGHGFQSECVYCAKCPVPYNPSTEIGEPDHHSRISHRQISQHFSIHPLQAQHPSRCYKFPVRTYSISEPTMSCSTDWAGICRHPPMGVKDMACMHWALWCQREQTQETSLKVQGQACLRAWGGCLVPLISCHKMFKTAWSREAINDAMSTL